MCIFSHMTKSHTIYDISAYVCQIKHKPLYLNYTMDNTHANTIYASRLSVYVCPMYTVQCTLTRWVIGSRINNDFMPNDL